MSAIAAKIICELRIFEIFVVGFYLKSFLDQDFDFDFKSLFARGYWIFVCNHILMDFRQHWI